jgi:hypothetical protein
VDATRFDRLARALSGVTSRRGASRALAGLALIGGMSSRPGLDLALAGKKRKKKCKKTCGPCRTCKKGKCKPNTAACRKGQVCLGNGSCAIACGTDGSICGAVGCGGACPQSIEGSGQCAQGFPTCDLIPQVCASTKECPVGQHCEETGCPGTFRCVPLCTGTV